MTTTDLTPTPRELLAHAIATLRSRSQRPGTIAESIVWVGNADDNGQVPIAMLIGGTHICSGLRLSGLGREIIAVSGSHSLRL